MIDITLEHQNNIVVAFVSDSGTGSTTTVGGNSEAQAIQRALSWANLYVKIRGDVVPTGEYVEKEELNSLRQDSIELQSIQAAESEGFGQV